jgi:hypothetical protein
MSTTTSAGPTLHELSHRSGGGLVVALIWDADRDSVILSVDDLATGDRIRVEPRRGRERYAFEHPFAYLSSLPKSGDRS